MRILTAQPRKAKPRCRICYGPSRRRVCRECREWDITLRHIEAANLERRARA